MQMNPFYRRQESDVMRKNLSDSIILINGGSPMFGLIISDPDCNSARRSALCTLLHDLDLPFSGFTELPAPHVPSFLPRAAFLRAASTALLQPGQPLPMAGLLTHLQGDPLPANVLRRHLLLQRSLMPYLRPGRAITQLNGCFMLGSDLLVSPVSAEDVVDAELPPGVWTELNGDCHEGRLHCMRGYNETPVLARANALLPIGMNGQSLALSAEEDADRLTLHWFQPADEAACTLADGTRYHAQCTEGRYEVHTESRHPFHLIVHRDGTETLVR